MIRNYRDSQLPELVTENEDRAANTMNVISEKMNRRSGAIFPVDNSHFSGKLGAYPVSACGTDSTWRLPVSTVFATNNVFAWWIRFREHAVQRGTSAAAGRRDGSSAD